MRTHTDQMTVSYYTNSENSEGRPFCSLMYSGKLYFSVSVCAHVPPPKKNQYFGNEVSSLYLSAQEGIIVNGLASKLKLRMEILI